MKAKCVLVKIICLALILPAICSCSLKYGEDAVNTSNVPELIFSDVTLTRYKEAEQVFRLNAQKLEQYQDSTSFASKVDFAAWEHSPQEQDITTGKCALLGIDESSEKYTLFGEIEIQNQKEGEALVLNAESLLWNGKTEQLTSDGSTVVHLRRGSLFLEGTGFAASGISHTFSFTGAVQGTLEDEAEP